jgi:hypothetical protein
MVTNFDASFLSALSELTNMYLSGNISGKGFVHQFDDLMASEKCHCLSTALRARLDDFQIALALYVEDERNRREDPAYYGPDGLTQQVTVLQNMLGEFKHFK